MGTAPEEYYWDIANATKIGQYLTKKEAKFIDSVLEGNPYNKSCLDIGAGSGRFAIPLYEKGFAVVALEYDLIPLRKICEKNKNIPTIHAML
jgi:2-polyprenyl-3-methyl-5-hydroxy-6-metoxy-1,4-benzoquinol methylase